jgi:hypothetical protein
LVRALLAALAAAPVAACGRRGSLIPPEGGIYPAQYPRVGFPSKKSPDSTGDETTEDQQQ